MSLQKQVYPVWMILVNAKRKVGRLWTGDGCVRGMLDLLQVRGAHCSHIRPEGEMLPYDLLVGSRGAERDVAD